MNDGVFDAITRRAATSLHRRGLLGLISHGALAVALPPLRTLAKNDLRDDHGGGAGNSGGGGGGDKDKKEKRCRKQSHACALTVGGYCDLHYSLAPVSRAK